MSQGESKDSLSETQSALVTPFLKLKVSDLDLSNRPIVLSAALTPRQALQELMKHHIRCAPVVSEGKFIGVFDLRDSIKHAVDVYRKKHLTDEDVIAMEYIAVSPHISTNTLAYLARMRRFWAVKESDPLVSVMKVVTEGSHIVGVLSSDGKKLLTILSQGEIFQQVSEYWKEVGSPVTLEELMKAKIATCPVISIGQKTAAHEAFEMMANHQLSGLAVVDENGKLVHNTSATDIKLWLDASHSLDESIEEFLIAVRKHQKNPKKKVLYPVASLGVSDPFMKCLHKLKVTGYHRMWVVDSTHKPVGVVALTDIFKFVCGKDSN